MISPMLSASNFLRSSSRQSNVCLQFDLCFDSVGFTSFSVLTSWQNMHMIQNRLDQMQSPAFASKVSVTCYDLKLLSLVKQKEKFSDTGRLNSTCYNTFWFLCDILTDIWSGVRKLTGIRTEVRKLKRIVDTYGFACLIMSVSICRQRTLCRYVSYRLWF